MSNIIHPFITKENYCMHCGTKNSLRYIDLRNEPHSQMIYSTSKAKCEKCNAEFFIHWISEGNDGMAHYYSDKDIIEKFSSEIIEKAKMYRRKL